MTADTVGGVWSYALTLAHGLRAHGVSTTLAILGPPASMEQCEEVSRIEGVTTVNTGLPLDWLAADETSLCLVSNEIAALSRASGADIVHLNSPVFAGCATFAPAVLGVCHSCLATWWDATRGGELPPDFAWRTDLVARGYAACDRLVAPSAAYGRMIDKRYGVTPHVVANAARAPDGTTDTVKEHFVLTAGRLWDEGKNFSTLDTAAGLLDAPVYAAGDLVRPPSNTTACRNAIALGRLGAAELKTWLARASIFVSVALYEPFGLAVLEAAQHGCALVLSDRAGFHEIWGNAALYVPARDATALATTLQMLLDNPALAARMGRAARERAKLYSIEALADGMMSLYREIGSPQGLAV